MVAEWIKDGAALALATPRTRVLSEALAWRVTHPTIPDWNPRADLRDTLRAGDGHFRQGYTVPSASVKLCRK